MTLITALFTMPHHVSVESIECYVKKVAMASNSKKTKQKRKKRDAKKAQNRSREMALAMRKDRQTEGVIVLD